jgi:hypothetical protein
MRKRKRPLSHLEKGSYGGPKWGESKWIRRSVRSRQRAKLCPLRIISDYADWTKAGPGLESRASLDAGGMINIWVDLKKVLPDLPPDYARPVKEWATDPEESEKCPPLNIVIFIVGSRG